MATLLSVKEMIDSALGAPDAQIINFKLLHTLLHLLAQQMRVLERKVELRDYPEVPGQQTDVVISEVRLGAQTGRQASRDTLLVDSRERGRIAVVTIDQFANLEGKVNKLAKELGLADTIAKQYGTSVISPGQMPLSGQTATGALQPGPNEFLGPDGKIYQTKGPEKTASKAASRIGSTESRATGKVDAAHLSDSLTNIKMKARIDALDKGMMTVTELVDELMEEKKKPKSVPHDWAPEFKLLTTKVDSAERTSRELGIQVLAQKALLDGATARVVKLEECCATLTGTVQGLESNATEQIASIQEQLTDLQYDIEASIKDIQVALELTGGDQALLAEIAGKVEGLTIEMDNVAADLNSLFSSKVKNDGDLAIIMEQVSNLKMCKVDREEMVDALLDKADVAQLNKIVTMDEYNADLTITRSKQTNADERIQELKDFCNVTFEDVQKSLDARANLDETAYSLRDHQHHLEELDKRMHAVEHEIKPHPAAGVVSFWSNCLSCATPSILAGGDSQDPCPPPMLPPLPVSQPPQKNFSPPSRYCGGPHTSRPSPRFFPVLPPQALTMDCDEIQIPMVRQLTSDHTSFICKCDPNPCDFKPAPGPNNDDAQD